MNYKNSFSSDSKQNEDSYYLKSSVLNVDRMMTHLAPNPSYHFISTAFSPFVVDINNYKIDYSVEKLTESCLSKESYMVEYDEKNNNSVSSILNYWGEFTYSDIVKTFPSSQERLRFVDCSQSGLMCTLSKCSPLSFENTIPIHRCVSVLNNSCMIKTKFENIANKYHLMMKKKAYLNWFTDDGMEMNTFKDARTSLGYLIEFYRDIKEELVSNDDVSDYDY